MIQESAYSLHIDEAPPLTIQSEDKVRVFHPRIPPRREAVIGAKISIGIHIALMLFILLLPCFSNFHVGVKPSFIAVSLVSTPGDKVNHEQIVRSEATDEIRQQPEHGVVEKSLPIQSHIPIKKEKKEITKSKTNLNPSLPFSLGQLTSQSDKNTTEQETEKGLGAGDGMNPATPVGGPVPTGSEEFTMKQVDQPPTPALKIEPEFPLTARRLGIGGRVVVKFLVKADGNVTRASIVEADPREIFEKSALEAVREWRFNPGRFHGEAVATWVVLPIQFRLTQ